MKSVKGKLLKKLKSIKPPEYLKQDRVLQVLAADGVVDFLPKITHFASQTLNRTHLNQQETKKEDENEKSFVYVREPDVIDVPELMRDSSDEDDGEEDRKKIGFAVRTDEKENMKPALKEKDSIFCGENMENQPVSDTGQFGENISLLDNVSGFRRPDLNSNSLFDPKLLAAFEEAVKELKRVREAERKARMEQEKLIQKKTETATGAEYKRAETKKNEVQNRAEKEQEVKRPHKAQRIDDEHHNENEDEDPLSQFEKRCPPGGEQSVILYTTTLRGIRKTFEECTRVRFLLESFRVPFYERDVSMHREYKEELWRTMERKAMPPALFVKGRCIGGAQEVSRLNEQGKFRALFQGIQLHQSDTPCEGCTGVRFMVCFNCSGSHKVVSDNGLRSACLLCNENGLIVCPVCCVMN